MNTLALSANTQAFINNMITVALTMGVEKVRMIGDKLTKEQLVNYISTVGLAVQETQIQNRSLAKSLVFFLVELYKNKGKGHYNDISRNVKDKHGSTVSDYSSLRYWGLIEKDDHLHDNGYWKLTDDGLKFLKGELKLPNKLTIHNNRVIKESTKKVSINDFTILDWQGFKPVVKSDHGSLLDQILN
jgi:hypothetical protein